MAFSRGPERSNLSSPPQGIPKDVLEGEADPKFLCNICQELLDSPMQGICGHRFCDQCVKFFVSHAQGRTAVCPACENEPGARDSTRESIPDFKTKGSFYPDAGIRRDISSLETKCLNSGCTWRGPFKKYKSHRDRCRVKMTGCPMCGQQMPHEAEGDHYILECPKRMVQCLHCKQPVQADELGNHGRDCSKTEDWTGNPNTESIVGTLCPYECGAVMTSPQEYHHHCGEAIREHVALIFKMSRHLQQHNDQSLTSSLSSSQGSIPEHRNQTTISMAGCDSQPVSNENIRHFEQLTSVLIQEIERTNEQNKELEKQQNENKGLIRSLQQQVERMENNMASKDSLIGVLEQRVDSLEMTSYDGRLTWRISHFSRRRQEAMSETNTSFYSPVFYTSRKGYKMRARLYLEGDGIGKGHHVSLFIVLMRGEFDGLLRWPFEQTITFKMIDQGSQGNHVFDRFRPDPTSSAFRRPVSDMNVASGCPMFMPIEELDSPRNSYVKDDVAFIEIEVDPNHY